MAATTTPAIPSSRVVPERDPVDPDGGAVVVVVTQFDFGDSPVAFQEVTARAYSWPGVNPVSVAAWWEP
jgi:hypothetical protein